MTSLLTDLRYGLRSMLRTPGVTATAVLSLAVGIGANAAIFSLLDAFGLRPLPVADEGQLVRIYSNHLAERQRDVSYPDYLHLRESNHAFSDLLAYSIRGIAVSSGAGAPEVVMMGVVSGNYFSTLGVRPIVGRAFLPEEATTTGARQVAIISYRMWQRRFGGSPAISGTSVVMNSEPWTIVGVLPPEFAGLDSHLAPDVWVPIMSQGGSEYKDRANRGLTVVGRLKDGVTAAQARAEAKTIMAGLARAYPATNKDWTASASPLRDVRRRVVSTLGPILMVIVGLVLLIACANVAGLLIGRAEARRREIAVRVALGAGRGRLVRQLLGESALLSACAAAAGLLLAFWLIRLLPALIPPTPLPLGYAFHLDARVLTFTLLVAALVVPVFGLVPALTASRPDVLPALRGHATAGTRGMPRLRIRNLLVIGQITVSMVLLVGSALLVRSLWASQRIDPGFSRDPALLVTLSPGVAGYDDARSRAFLNELAERVSALPGVRNAALARRIPLSPFGGGATVPVTIPGAPARTPDEPAKLRYNVVGVRYFDTMGIRLRQGRDFNAGDGPGAPRVVIINDRMARQSWPDGDALGRMIRVGGATQPIDWRVIGIVQDGRYLQLTETPEPHLFFPFGQRSSSEMTLIARMSGDEGAMATAVRREIQALSPGMPTLQLMTLADHMRFALYSQELMAALVGIIGAAGMLLAVVGLYGVISYLVAQRTREIGIRMALGARRRDVSLQIVRRGLGLAGIGVATGLICAFWAGRFLEGSLYGVSARDPLAFVATALVVVAVTAIASYLPARRAARVDPLVALRCE